MKNSEPVTTETPAEEVYFKDYRDYLRHRYLDLKETKRVSYTTIGKKIGVSKSSVSHIVNKKNHLAADKIISCVNAFKIPAEMIEYFIFSYFLSTASSEEIKTYLEKILTRISAEKKFYGNRTFRPFSDKQLYLSDEVLKPILLCMTQFKDFSEDPEWIKNQLINKEVDISEIKSSVEDLLEDDILKKTPQASGKPKYSYESFIGYGPAYLSQQRTELGTAWFDLIKQYSANTEAYAPCRTTTLTIAFKRENFNKLNDLITKFKHDITDLETTNGDADCILHLENICFAVARAAEKA